MAGSFLQVVPFLLQNLGLWLFQDLSTIASQGCQNAGVFLGLLIYQKQASMPFVNSCCLVVGQVALMSPFPVPETKYLATFVAFHGGFHGFRGVLSGFHGGFYGGSFSVFLSCRVLGGLDLDGFFRRVLT